MKLDDEEYVAKPMNCPHHFQIYLVRPRSYRELPLRIAENATVYRFEKAGELNGLLRVRALTQDDSHIFIRHNQIAQEIDRILDLAVFIFQKFGFSDYRARISVRDPKTLDTYMGVPKNWDKAEEALVEAVKSAIFHILWVKADSILWTQNRYYGKRRIGPRMAAYDVPTGLRPTRKF